MTINEYQKLAMTTLNPALSEKEVLLNGVMGLCGESGEAIDLVKKWMMQGLKADTCSSLYMTKLVRLSVEHMNQPRTLEKL